MTITNKEELVAYMKELLGYCPCSDGATLSMLEEFLSLLREKEANSTRAAVKKAEYKDFREEMAALEKVNEKIHSLINASPGLMDWFVLTLDRARLVTHNFRITDVWITDKGHELLDLLKRFHE